MWEAMRVIMNNMEFEEIRLLPMSKDEFHSYDDVYDWLYGGMHRGEGMYYYKRRSINFNSNILVMFQYDNEVIATAIMINEEMINESADGYNGIYYFDVDSILILEKPISKFDIQKIDKTFKNFSQATTKFNKDVFADLVELITQNAILINNNMLEYTSIVTEQSIEGKNIK